MEYVGRVPAPPLDRYIDDIYCLTGTPRYRRLNVPPMPSAHLFLNLADPVTIHDSDPAVPPSVFTDGWFMGVRTRRYVVEFPAAVRIIGVHFKPWGLAPLVGLPPSQLRDRSVPVDAVPGWAWERMRDRMADASIADVLRLLEDELRAHVATPFPVRGSDLVLHTAGRLAASWGAITVAALAGNADVSGNYLAAQFKSYLGVTPKQMARIYRFARVILTVEPQHPVDWARLAHGAGYFDQAHLSNEFKHFTGHTPTGYLELRRRLPAQPRFPPDAGPMPAE